MASVAASELATHAAALRAELKNWEREFTAANGGKKAGRGDIKKVPEIAAKYKEYSRLKSQESPSNNKDEKSHSKPIDPDERPKKRKHSSLNGPEQHTQTATTPRKSGKGLFQTPSKTRTTHPANVDPYDSPSVLRRLFSPSTHMQSSSPFKTAIGPTPQRDGKALGLFDLLSESGGSTATPSATRIASVKGMAAQTPSKKRKTMDTIMEEEEDEEEDALRAERTPASSARKNMLSALFATPTAWKYSSIVEDEASRGSPRNIEANKSPRHTTNPDSASLETPSFLRRSTSGLYGSTNTGANQGGLSPIPVRKPPQFVGKGLSQIVQGLRDMEEERLEDELDVLREMETEQPGMDDEVANSQIPPPDTTAPGRPYKKKGQKRTTRLVRMKPVVSSKPATKPQSQRQTRSQPTSTLAVENADVGESEGSDDDLVAAAETQADTTGPTAGKNHNDADTPDQFEDGDWDPLHSISEAEADSDVGSDLDYDVDSRPLGRTKSFSEKMMEAIGTAGSQPQESKDMKQAQGRAKEKKVEEKENADTKKPSTRKVNPQAHANYRSLKIRNRGGRGRGSARFRRR
ncbi:DNA replication/checkpoint protein [Aspergillus aurantiobrunneus]